MPSRRSLIRPVIFTAVAALAGVATVAALSRGTDGDKDDRIDVASLRPPDRYVAGMRLFMDAVDETSTRTGRGSGAVSPHGEAIWGYYLALLDQEPWRAQLIAQGSRTPEDIRPRFPIEGGILSDPALQGRVLELYVSVSVMPNQDWARWIYQNGVESTSGSFRTPGVPCDYSPECVSFELSAPSVPNRAAEFHRLWRWRTGRIAINVSALGPPGWPAEAITPLVEYYAKLLPTLPSVYSDAPASPSAPPVRSLSP